MFKLEAIVGSDAVHRDGQIVGPRTVVDRVDAGTAVEDIFAVAHSAFVKDVVAGIAVFDVVAKTTDQRVVAEAAIERVVAAATDQHVVARTTRERAGCDGARQEVVGGAADHSFDVVDDVVAFSQFAVVVAARAGRFDVSNHRTGAQGVAHGVDVWTTDEDVAAVGDSAFVEGVVARAAVEGVVAVAAGEDVVAVAAEDHVVAAAAGEGVVAARTKDRQRGGEDRAGTSAASAADHVVAITRRHHEDFDARKGHVAHRVGAGVDARRSKRDRVGDLLAAELECVGNACTEVDGNPRGSSSPCTKAAVAEVDDHRFIAASTID